MSYNINSPVADALREAGYIPLPRLWIKREEIPEIHAITERNATEVNRIRHAARNTKEQSDKLIHHKDPFTDKDAAWNAMEKMRSR